MTTLRIPVSMADHCQGPDDAPLTLVKYGDYECPYCAVAHPIVRRLQARFGDRLRYAFRNFPLREVHPNAEAAAETAEFAGAHGKFWEMHELLFENHRSLGPQLYSALTERLRLSPNALRTALNTEIYGERVYADFVGGVRSGVSATPTFFINGRRHDGSYEFEILAAALNDIMKTT